MLYAYPVAAVAAVASNWLHEALCSAIRSIHENLDAGEQVPDWPSLIPAEYRSRLRRRRGLAERLQAYVGIVAGLPPDARGRILRAMVEQNAILRLVSCSSHCDAVDDLAPPIRRTAAELFGFAFRLLTGLGIRDAHYGCIYEHSKYHLCAFCGCEYFDAPGAPREALDHYISYERYPFAAANLHNLVPMGNKCNSRYKLAQDILRADDGSRRRSYYPYGEIPEMSISLNDSIPFAGVGGELPCWDIQFCVESEEVDTWLTVFCIRERYARDVLNEGFKSWLQEFAMWSRASPLADADNETILHLVADYAECLAVLGLNDRAFLKAAVFRMLHRRCRDGNERLLAMMRDLVVCH